VAHPQELRVQYYGIHYDFIKYLSQIGLNLIDIVIWHKSSSIPVGEGNLKDNFEYILGFSKSNIKQITLENIDFKDYLNNAIPPTTLNMWNMNRISGSLTKGLPHPAMYPEELPKRLIQCLTSEGDTVLDPFLGSGSTMAASIELNRSCVGYELNKDYIKIIKAKTTTTNQGLFASNNNIEFIES
jgi:DNA modification methylase